MLRSRLHRLLADCQMATEMSHSVSAYRQFQTPNTYDGNNRVAAYPAVRA